MLVMLFWPPLASAQAQAPAATQDAKPQEVPPEIALKDWDRALTRIEKRVATRNIGSIEARDLRAQLEVLLRDSRDLRDRKTDEAAKVEALSKSLGVPPADGEAPEADEVRAKRKQLADELATHKGHAQRSALLAKRAEQILSDMATATRERLKATLLERGPPPVRPDTWLMVIPELVAMVFRSYVELPAQWAMEIVAGGVDLSGALGSFVLFGLVLSMLTWPLRRWLLLKLGRRDVAEPPKYARRLVAGVAEGTARGLIPAVFVASMALMLTSKQVMSGDLLTVVSATAQALVAFLFGYALINAVFPGTHPEWRLFDLDEVATRMMARRLKVMLLIFLAFDGTRGALGWATPSAELEATYALVFALVLFPVLVSLLARRMWIRATPEGDDDGETQREAMVVRFRVPLALGLFVIPASAAMGFARFSVFLSHAIVQSGILLGGLLLARAIVREGVAVVLVGRTPFSRKLRHLLSLGDMGSKRLSMAMNIILDLGLLTLASIVALPIWGMETAELAVWIKALAGGIQIGSFTFAPLDLVFGVLAFMALWGLTRLLQRMLSRHVFPTLTQDTGIQDSLRTGVGYIGFLVAVMVGISTLGLDLSNLALIAGALSVGIGFGLQNVVNNFVSGLILLVERPVKVGDWVVVGGVEGNVKRINVRSTEVETFAKASVIIPNSEMISTAVVNWTHKDISGRVEVLVGVAYGSDIDKVKEILVRVAKEHPETLPTPTPFVVFQNFGASSLDFELRAFLGRVERRVRVASDLREAIYHEFRDAGIEIPFPQTVLHIEGSPAAPSPLSAATPSAQPPSPSPFPSTT